MVRFVFAACLFAAPTLVQANEELCKVSAEIAGAAVVERAAGAEPDAAIKAVTDGLDGPAESYAAAVQPIVEWVYTLPDDQLTDEVATAYELACLAQ